MNTLEKEFVPYQQALALKELGFNEPCLGYYTIYSDGEVKLFTSDKGFRNLEAPTFSQAFRWFREKCGYDVHIRGTIFRASYVIGIPKEIYIESADGYPVVVSWDYIIDKTGERKIYEEAELECLNKLIEIVKKNL